MGDPRWRMFPIPFLVINYDVIMTSLLFLKIIRVLALLLSSFCSTSMSMSNAQKLEMMSTLLCVILWP